MRHYLGVRDKGQIHRFTMFDGEFEKLLNAGGGFLPPFVYQYHFAFLPNTAIHPDCGKRFDLYRSWPGLKHDDGISLGAWSADAIIEILARIEKEREGEVMG